MSAKAEYKIPSQGILGYPEFCKKDARIYYLKTVQWGENQFFKAFSS